MTLSVIIPTQCGRIPENLPSHSEVEVIIVRGVAPISAARNEGLKRATGEYVAWVDSDDEISKEWLPSILKGLEAKPDVLSFDANVIWMDAKRCLYKIGGLSYAADVMAERVNGQLWNKVIKRRLFEGLSFVGAMHEDYRILCELLPRAKSFIHLDKVLYVYRRNSNGLSQYGDVESGLKAILELISFSCNASDKWRNEIIKGAAQRAADFCRHAKSLPELRAFIRKALPLIWTDMDLSFRTKIKCLCASLGI